MTDELDVALAVAAALESLGVPYFLGGSLASSLQGEPRSTNDVDFVVDLAVGQVDGLATALGPDFDLDTDALKDAVTRRGSWNLFHLPLVVKIDLFVMGSSEYDREEMSRRRRVVVRADASELYLKTPEDTILRKLLWYREGGLVSDRQWRDIVGVLRISSSELDGVYLDQWASRLDLTELLQRAREQATRSS